MTMNNVPLHLDEDSRAAAILQILTLGNRLLFEDDGHETLVKLNQAFAWLRLVEGPRAAPWQDCFGDALRTS